MSNPPSLRENPKLEALNPFDFAQDRPKQIPISKFKIQNLSGHWDFGYLILFSISDLGFRILFFRGVAIKL